MPITPITPNSAAVLQFKSGQIAGGWEPAPYDIEMVQDGGHVLVNEASLWPQGQFVTTNLVVTQKFLAAHPSVVNGLLKGQIEANNYIHSNPSGARGGRQHRADLPARQGPGPERPVGRFQADHLHQRPDRRPRSRLTRSTRSRSACSTRSTNMSALYDLGPLNALLKAAGQPQVSS